MSCFCVLILKVPSNQDLYTLLSRICRWWQVELDCSTLGAPGTCTLQ